MVKEAMFETAERPERALLVGIDRPDDTWPMTESLNELASLASTAGAEVVGRVSQKLIRPNARTLVGKGKVAETASLATALDVDVVLFDSELSPSQQANLESEIKGVKILDRTALILDIFALHAQTREGRLQVRLAQSQYLLPRLRGMWAHLVANRMGGGVGSRFGEGESQLEVDRRMVRKRIDSIQRELAGVARERAVQRKTRSSGALFRLALAGYTNAGKSSLLNRLTGADAPVMDQLFATLDATTRKLTLPGGREMLLTDTVGFIHKLPHGLVEAFKSTLDEISNADLILHIVDACAGHYLEHIQAVNEVLAQIDAAKTPQVLVFNKSDLLSTTQYTELTDAFPQAVFISAQTGTGITALHERIEQTANAQMKPARVLIPFDQGALVKLAYDYTSIITEKYTSQGTELELLLPPRLAARFEPFILT
ncbi:MAG: GTPase HflX [Coriobacteriales bacterium]|jgi:GTP-binding protein HflX|nr:GTPase HflX [Coriobacteriales bacterium]